MNPNAEKVSQVILKAVEDKVDAEIEKLENLQLTDLENIRKARLAAMKQEKAQEDEWRKQGHGEYVEIREAEFFATVKKSNNMIVHFFLDDKRRCEIVDHHLRIVASRHLKPKIVKINAMNARFLTTRLSVTVIPTILVIVNNKTVDKVVGFTDLGGRDDFSTEMLEWRLSQSGIIKYEGECPNVARKADSLITLHPSQTSIRRTEDSDSDADDEESDLWVDSISQNTESGIDNGNSQQYSTRDCTLFDDDELELD